MQLKGESYPAPKHHILKSPNTHNISHVTYLNTLLLYSTAGTVARPVVQNPMRWVALATKLCTVSPNICRNFSHVTTQAATILKWLLNFWKNL